MDPDEVWRQLEGHENIIKPELEKLEKYFSTLRCPACQGPCRPILNSKQVFEEGAILPNYLAECNKCASVFSPYTGIEVSGPTPNLDP